MNLAIAEANFKRIAELRTQLLAIKAKRKQVSDCTIKVLQNMKEGS